MKPVYKRKISAAVIAASIVLTMSITVFAAWHFLSQHKLPNTSEIRNLRRPLLTKMQRFK